MRRGTRGGDHDEDGRVEEHMEKDEEDCEVKVWSGGIGLRCHGAYFRADLAGVPDQVSIAFEGALVGLCLVNIIGCVVDRVGLRWAEGTEQGGDGWRVV